MDARSSGKIDVTERHYKASLVTVWVAFQITGGQVGIPILLATLAFSKLRRLPTLFSLLATWSFASIIGTILFYTDHAFPSDPPPSYELCLMQAALIYGVPLMTSLAALALVYEGWLAVSGREDPIGPPCHFFRTATLLLLPWLGLLVASISTFAAGYMKPKHVNRTRRVFYCSVKNDSLSDALAVIMAIVLSITVIVAAKTAYVLRATWVNFKIRVAAGTQPCGPRIASAQTHVRIAIFGLYVFVALALSLVSIVAPKSPFPDLVASTGPTAIFLTFATQADIIKIWIKLIPNILVPRSISTWVNAKPHDDGDEPLDLCGTPTTAAPPPPPKSPRTPSNTFDVWKRKYFDPAPPQPELLFPTRAVIKGSSDVDLEAGIGRYAKLGGFDENVKPRGFDRGVEARLGTMDEKNPARHIVSS